MLKRISFNSNLKLAKNLKPEKFKNLFTLQKFNMYEKEIENKRSKV